MENDKGTAEETCPDCGQPTKEGCDCGKRSFVASPASFLAEEPIEGS